MTFVLATRQKVQRSTAREGDLNVIALVYLTFTGRTSVKNSLTSITLSRQGTTTAIASSQVYEQLQLYYVMRFFNFLGARG